MVVVDNRKKTNADEKKATPVKIKVESDNDDDDDMVVIDKRKISPAKGVFNDDDVDDEKLNEVMEEKMEVEEEEEEQKENLNAAFDSDSSIDITAIECQVFKNKVFYLNQDLPSSTVLKFTHIIKNMLGVITKDPSKANYIITKHGRNLPKSTDAEVVKDTWIQECFDLQAFIPTNRYQL